MTQLFIVLDTETTGIPRSLESDVRPVSFGAAAYTVDGMEEVARTHFLVRPGVWARGWQRAEAIHGLSREKLDRDGLSLADGWERLVAWFAQTADTNGCAAGEMYPMAWSSQFDRLVLSIWARAAGNKVESVISWPEWSEGELRAPEGCLQALYRDWTRGQPGIKTPRYGKLKTAAEMLGVGTQTATHNALADARLAAGVLAALREREKAPLARAHK
jgi:DNA polymerase III epsilon subunit-like protein